MSDCLGPNDERSEGVRTSSGLERAHKDDSGAAYVGKRASSRRRGGSSQDRDRRNESGDSGRIKGKAAMKRMKLEVEPR